MGGHGQYMAFGHGGSSAFLAPAGSSSYLMRSGYNFGNGRVQVLACPQHQCPANSTCMFEKPTELEESPVAFCLCNFGERKVPLDSSTCSSNI